MPTSRRPILTDLADQLLDTWHLPEQERRPWLWADHFAGRSGEVPVSSAMFQGSQDLVWQQIIPEETVVHKEGLASTIEIHLRQHIRRARHTPDAGPVAGRSPIQARSSPFVTNRRERCI